MASQKDLNDMLNLTPGQQQQQQQQKGGKLTKVLKKDKGEEALVFTKKRRRPKGCIGREVEQLRQASIHLTNNAQPSIVPDYSGKAGDDDGNGGAGGGEDGFKKKRSLLLAKGEGGESGGTKWVWKGFTNPARGEHDKTVFYHWAPSTDVNDEYEFARFNKKAPVITYTKDEYRDNLTGPSASDYGKNVFTNEDEEEDFEYYDVTNDESSDESESDDDDDDDDNNNDDDDGSNNGSSDNGNKNSGVNDKTKSNNECSVNEDSESVYAKRSSSRNSNKNNTKKKRRRKRKTERKSITARFSDTNWTEKETDKLFELCERYDLRWVVITDRWNTDVIAENEGDDSDVESNTSSSVMGDSQGLRVYNYRTMEELKGRYYHVASKIATARKLPKANPYISYNFNIKSEARRKALLNRLHRRTADEVKEEEELLEVLQRIDQQLHKAQKVQEQPIPAITASTPSTGKKDNSAEGREEEVDDNECEAGEAGGDYESEEPMLKRIKTKKTAWTKPFMRSQMQYFPKPTKETEVELELEYGVKAVAVPTERSVNKYLELRSIVQKKQELERLVKQKEELVSLLKPNLARLSRELEATKKKRKAEEERKTLTSAKPITFCGVGASQPQDTTAAATTVVPKIN